MSNNSTTIPKSLYEFYQGAPELDAAEVAARFQHAFESNVKLKKENMRLLESLDAALSDLRILREENEKLRAVGKNYVSQLESRCADFLFDRDKLLIEVGYLRREVERLKGEKL